MRFLFLFCIGTLLFNAVYLRAQDNYQELSTAIEKTIDILSEQDDLDEKITGLLLKNIEKGYKAFENNLITDFALQNEFIFYQAWQYRYLQGNNEQAMRLLKQCDSNFLNDKKQIAKLPFLYAKNAIEIAYLEHFFLYNYKEAEKYYLQALAYMDKKNIFDYTNIALKLTTIYRDINNYEKAIYYAQNAINLRRENLGIRNIAYVSALNVLASTYEAFDEYRKAENLYLEAIALYNKYHKGQFKNKYIELISNLGVLYLTQDRVEQAEPLLLEVMNFDKIQSGTSSANFAFSCHNLAILYTNKKEYATAKIYYEICLRIEEKLGNDMQIAYTLRNFGDYYKEIKDNENALKCYQKSLDIYNEFLETEGTFIIEHIETLNSLAELFFELQEYNKSIATIQLNLSLQEKSQYKSPNYYLQSLLDLSKSYIEKKDFANAEKYLYLSLSTNSIHINDLDNLHKLIMHKSKYPEMTIKQIQQLALLKERKSKNIKSKPLLQEAYSLLKIAFALNQKQKSNISGDLDKSIIFKNLYHITQKLFDIGLELQQNSFIEDAFVLVESNKGVLLSDAIKAQEAKHLLPKDLSNKEEELSAQKIHIEQQLKEVLSQEEENKLRTEEVYIKQKFEILKKQIETEYPKYYQAKYDDKVATITDVQQSLKKHELMLQYLVTDSTVYCIALSQLQSKIYSIPVSATMISDSVKHMQKLLSDFSFLERNPKSAYDEYIAVAHWFYKSLLADILHDFSTETTLIIIPDAELGVLPFEAFLTTNAPTNSIVYAQLPYLIKSHSVIYHYSASLWLYQRLNPKTANIKYGKVLAMASSYNDNYIIPNNRTENTKVLRSSLKSLKSVQLELDAIKQKYAGTFYIEEDSNEEVFKNKAADYDIIHLAMHGLGNKANAAYSALFFTENGSKTQDNVLEAWEIMQLSLNARLVVLSACESGIGTFLRGEGVSSLARAFLYAGSSSVLVSLWKVNDQATAALMRDYYHVLSQVKEKSMALRAAKLEFLNTYTGNIAHPAYWAGFIQIGDDTAIAPADTKNVWYAFLGGSFFFCVGGYGIWKIRKNKLQAA